MHEQYTLYKYVRCFFFVRHFNTEAESIDVRTVLKMEDCGIHICFWCTKQFLFEELDYTIQFQNLMIHFCHPPNSLFSLLIV